MELTRLKHDTLRVAVERASKKLDEALALLVPHLAELTDGERLSMLRPRDGFVMAGRRLAQASENHPELVKVVDFDAEAVREDLDNVEALVGIEMKSDRLARLISDSRLRWLAEAYQPSLQLYGVAKAAAKHDGALRAVVEPMADIFPGRRARKKPEEEGEPNK